MLLYVDDVAYSEVLVPIIRNLLPITKKHDTTGHRERGDKVDKTLTYFLAPCHHS